MKILQKQKKWEMEPFVLPTEEKGGKKEVRPLLSPSEVAI